MNKKFKKKLQNKIIKSKNWFDIEIEYAQKYGIKNGEKYSKMLDKAIPFYKKEKRI